MMPYLRPSHCLRWFIVIIALIILTACTKKIENKEFTFSPLFGFKTKEFESNIDTSMNADYLLFSQKGHLYFQIYRQEIPPGSDLEMIFSAHISKPVEPSFHYQFISQSKIESNGEPAIEYIFREFHGEPYVQTREIWIEKDGMIYTLACTEPVDSTPGMVIPVSETCYELADGFQFK
jgi:hypothetical protein